MKERMQNSSLKQEFLKNWIKGLQLHTNFNKNTTILERRKAIKLSADIAIASTRNSTTRWSRALISDASRDGSNKTLIEKISGREAPRKDSFGLIRCSKKIMKRSRVTRQIRARKAVLPSVVGASLIEKKLVKSRTRALKRLVPGGEDMDEISLIKETIDYIVSLRVQVDVMGRMASVADRLIPFKSL
ncbi:transcription factor IBH1-like 1 [Primulina huaijiensis]|uniref:transcription factor IBH1-like 1 n=1 Tax=Primulina huaijiensis TaxID=1492673 RepID=UPI003CC78EE4